MGRNGWTLPCLISSGAPGPVYLHLSCFQFGVRHLHTPSIYISMKISCRGLLLLQSARVCAAFRATGVEKRRRKHLLMHTEGTGGMRESAKAEASERWAGARGHLLLLLLLLSSLHSSLPQLKQLITPQTAASSTLPNPPHLAVFRPHPRSGSRGTRASIEVAALPLLLPQRQSGSD